MRPEYKLIVRTTLDQFVGSETAGAMGAARTDEISARLSDVDVEQRMTLSTLLRELVSEDLPVLQFPLDEEKFGSYTVARHRRGAVMLHHDFNGFEIVGQYLDDTLFMGQRYKGKGLSPFLVLARQFWDSGGEARDRTLTGLIAQRAAHRLAIKTALDHGVILPKPVLDDYPDLTGAEPADRIVQQKRQFAKT